MGNIIFNPAYTLKPDEGKALIMASLVGRNLVEGVEDSFTNIIHPIYAMILSFIDGRQQEECTREAASELGVEYDLVDNFVKKLLDNPNHIQLKSQGKISSFPPQTIISTDKSGAFRRYDPDMFAYSKIDLRMSRHKTPTNITLMVNNICVTDCIYCYQDKRRIVKCGIPLERIKQLIQEANKLHVRTFDVIGGEFFLYPHWREVLSELREFGYHPYLSTKMPLEEDDVKFLADNHIHDIQLSIDTMIEPHLMASLKVKPGYASKMLDTVRCLDRYGVPVKVHTVLTRYNDSIEDMQSIYNVLISLRNLVDWHIVKGDESLYPKCDYSEIEIDSARMNELIDYLEQLKSEGLIRIRFPQKQTDSDVNPDKVDFNSRVRRFFTRSFCSGLYSSLYILPDGQVTICEQLYWNKDFIVGNVMTENLIDIWNSEKSKSLFYLNKKDIPADSKCHDCNMFECCRAVRQVCYREIIRKYGKDKWYYPDVNCPYVNK